MEEIRMIYLAEDNTPTPRAGYGCGYACQAGFFCPGGLGAFLYLQLIKKGGKFNGRN